MSKKKKLPTATEIAIQNAHALASGTLTPADLAEAIAPRDNGLAPSLPPEIPTPSPKPTVTRYDGNGPILPVRSTPLNIGRRCPHCGIAWGSENEIDADYSLRCHVGAVEGVAPRCKVVRRAEGMPV